MHATSSYPGNSQWVLFISGTWPIEQTH